MPGAGKIVVCYYVHCQSIRICLKVGVAPPFIATPTGKGKEAFFTTNSYTYRWSHLGQMGRKKVLYKFNQTQFSLKISKSKSLLALPRVNEIALYTLWLFQAQEKPRCTNADGFYSGYLNWGLFFKPFQGRTENVYLRYTHDEGRLRIKNETHRTQIR